MTEERDRPLSTEDLAGVRRQETEETEGTDTETGTERTGAADTAYRRAETDTATGAHAADRTFGGAAGRAEDESAPLLSSTDTDGFRARWQELQSLFVDDPRKAVHAADELVAEVMQTVATTFGNRKHELEGQWQRGEEVETEHLRLALRQYRSFFNRLLST